MQYSQQYDSASGTTRYFYCPDTECQKDILTVVINRVHKTFCNGTEKRIVRFFGIVSADIWPSPQRVTPCLKAR